MGTAVYRFTVGTERHGGGGSGTEVAGTPFSGSEESTSRMIRGSQKVIRGPWDGNLVLWRLQVPPMIRRVPVDGSLPRSV